MAQQVEHILGKDEVTGSNPVISSRKNPGLFTSRDFSYSVMILSRRAFNLKKSCAGICRVYRFFIIKY